MQLGQDLRNWLRYPLHVGAKASLSPYEDGVLTQKMRKSCGYKSTSREK